MIDRLRHPETAFSGPWAGGWMIDRFGRRVGFAVLLIEAAVFMTIWIFAHDKIVLWLLGMAWSWGFIGVWGRLRPIPRKCIRPASAASVTGFRGP